MSTEAPVAPSPMSEERKRKMAEGRARALAEKKAKKEKREARAAAKAAAKAAQEIGVKVEAVNAPAVFEGPRAEILAPAPVASASPDLSAQIAEMRAQIDALKGIKASIPAAEATPAEPALKTTRKPEAWYEYKQKDGWKATAALGLNRIDDPEDEEAKPERHYVSIQTVLDSPDYASQVWREGLRYLQLFRSRFRDYDDIFGAVLRAIDETEAKLEDQAA